MKRVLTIQLAILLIGCGPTTDSPSPDDTQSMSASEIAERDEECDKYLSSANTNYLNRDYVSTIENYAYIIDLGCGKQHAPNIYEWMGRSYIELGKLDSANYIFKQGMKYLTEDESLLKVSAWTAGQLGNIEEQIYYLDQWLALDETNMEVLESLSDLYQNNEMFDEQITILNQWLKLDSNNKKANAEKKAAFMALGKDELDVDRERWEADPSNISYGLDYVKGLVESGRDEDVINNCNSLLVYEKYNTTVLKYLADSYSNLYKEDMALETYITISNIDPLDFSIAIEISKIYINLEDFQSAHKWAKAAMDASGSNGESIYQRAEVYFALAESCSKDPLSFWDKVVFEIAWEDYAEAAKSGYSRAKVRRDFLFENNITKSADWFMRPDNEVEVKPLGDCYSWIKRKISRK